MFIDYASGNVLKTRAKPSGAARRTDFTGVAFEQHANGRMFVDYASALGVSLISANSAGVRRVSQAAIGAAASAKISALDSIAGRGCSRVQTENDKRLTVGRIRCAEKYAHSVHACCTSAIALGMVSRVGWRPGVARCRGR